MLECKFIRRSAWGSAVLPSLAVWRFQEEVKVGKSLPRGEPALTLGMLGKGWSAFDSDFAGSLTLAQSIPQRFAEPFAVCGQMAAPVAPLHVTGQSRHHSLQISSGKRCAIETLP